MNLRKDSFIQQKKLLTRNNRLNQTKAQLALKLLAAQPSITEDIRNQNSVFSSYKVSSFAR